MWNNWYSRHKGKFKKMAVLVLCIAAALYGLCFYMSYKAADIFNQVVASRHGNRRTADGDARRDGLL